MLEPRAKKALLKAISEGLFVYWSMGKYEKLLLKILLIPLLHGHKNWLDYEEKLFILTGNPNK
ncbi:hypothetical protein GCM10009119_21060 [Algoriphagus jejuensis]|uniref:Uncharacterized protein n=1 Tax=Algoriphagus jejuensis TaxID=419934 RepID=A0ABN1MZZ6_9BACT